MATTLVKKPPIGGWHRIPQKKPHGTPKKSGSGYDNPASDIMLLVLISLWLMDVVKKR